MSGLKKKLYKNSKGFTLAEVMIAVALIMILLGLSVPNIIKQQQSLKKMELDRTAEEIYLSLQDSFSNVRLIGRLSEAMKEAGADYQGDYPSDYIGRPEGSESKKFHSMASESDKMYKDFVETFSLKALGLPFVAEYTESGDVYSVFYTEDADIKAILSSAAASGNVGTLNSYRDDKKVGYYTTKTLENSFFKDDDSLKVFVDPIVDGEDLFMNINIENGLNYAGVCSNITYYVKYTSGGKSVEKTYNGSGAKVDEKGNLVLKVVLDSVDEDVHFYEEVAPGLAVGQVQAMVTDVTFKGLNGKTISMEPGTPTSNVFHPLFYFASNESNIHVSNARHLNNLRGEYFKPDTEDIKIYQADDIDVSKISQYGPIRNDALFSGETVYNGNGHLITGLNISTDDGGYAGLFAKLACTVERVEIMNPHVNVDANYVGALCGEISGGKIIRCGVRCEKEQADGCFVNGYGECTGGLVGLASKTEIKDSFAAVDVTGCGGFAGKLVNCDVEHCYSSGKVTAVGYPAGGFAAYASGNIRNCYTTSDVVSSGFCGGFAYEVSDVSTCNAYGRVWDGVHIYIDDESFAPFAVTGSAENCYFCVMPGYNDVICYCTEIGESYRGYSTTPTERKAYNYAQTLDKHAGVFPFDYMGISKDIPHYGDWPHGYILVNNDENTDQTHICHCIVTDCPCQDVQPHYLMDDICLADSCEYQKEKTETGGAGEDETT